MYPVLPPEMMDVAIQAMVYFFTVTTAVLGVMLFARA